jgi:deoxyuridine 5''-triphosphate nucleotidohydrolase (EC 3.6.1.23)
MIDVSITRLPHAEGLDLPSYETSASAGMDLRAAVPADAPTPWSRGGVPSWTRACRLRCRRGTRARCDRGVDWPTTTG